MDALVELAPDAVALLVLLAIVAIVALGDAYLWCRRVDREKRDE